jgi:hypothetical protein
MHLPVLLCITGRSFCVPCTYFLLHEVSVPQAVISACVTCQRSPGGRGWHWRNELISRGLLLHDGEALRARDEPQPVGSHYLHAPAAGVQSAAVTPLLHLLLGNLHARGPASKEEWQLLTRTFVPTAAVAKKTKGRHPETPPSLHFLLHHAHGKMLQQGCCQSRLVTLFLPRPLPAAVLGGFRSSNSAWRRDPPLCEFHFVSRAHQLIRGSFATTPVLENVKIYSIYEGLSSEKRTKVVNDDGDERFLFAKRSSISMKSYRGYKNTRLSTRDD